MEKIGILTGGGDCPGLNAVIRAVVRRAHGLGYDVLGIKNGWAGLVQGIVEPLRTSPSPASFREAARSWAHPERIHSNKSSPFKSLRPTGKSLA